MIGHPQQIGDRKAAHCIVAISLVALIGVMAGCSSQPQVIQVTATPAPTNTPVEPVTLTVCSIDCDFTSIQAAIDDPGTIAGSTIEVLEAVHTEAGITVNKDLVIQGQGVENTIVQAHADVESATDRVFIVAEGTTVEMRDLTIQHGNRTEGGDSWGGDENGAGGILNLGHLTLERCVVRDNWARHGGGILNRGALRAVDSAFTGNIAHGARMPAMSCGAGGAIKHNGSTLELVNCTVSGNTADSNAGGIHVACDSRAVLTNCTVSGNTSEGGGAITVKGQLELIHCTVTDNTAASADDGGGIFVRGILSYTNTLIAGNHPGGDCTAERNLGGSQPGGTIGTNVSNLVGDGGCESVYSGDALLDILADNGGNTLTHSLLPGSPAVDAIPADDCTVATDQIGQPRPQGEACDIGAFELEQ